MTYFAHSENLCGDKEPVIDHLNQVANLARIFANDWGGGDEAYAAGLLHDIGKYSDLFQLILEGKVHHIDHASPGASVFQKLYRENGFAGAIAIIGHHDGLKSCLVDAVRPYLEMKNDYSPSNKQFSERDIEKLKQCFVKDDGIFPVAMGSDCPQLLQYHSPLASMLYIRMLYSALVDADFLATEAHFKRNGKNYIYRESPSKLNPEIALNKLLSFMDKVRIQSKANSNVNILRDDLFRCCLCQGSALPIGSYSLTSPTGSGKTLSMLAFALTHAARHKLKRIIFVLPFLNIIEQTALKYTEIFQEGGPEVLQDHSLAVQNHSNSARLLAENWDVPIVITTTVNFFEGLFANQSTGCRKLHNISDSIILFDEAQTMPPKLAYPTLGALAFLSQRYHCTTVFSTATQPAFDGEKTSAKIREYFPKVYSPQEIVATELNLFERAKRADILFRAERTQWQQLADEIKELDSVLVIVNLKKHARLLFQLIGEEDGDFHLSTNMCPAHRSKILAEVRSRLNAGKPCRLISTQCVEAGVDLDFPVVYRAMAPLEAIIQAAGRCNRNGRSEKGNVIVFTPLAEDEKYPSDFYEYGAITFKTMHSEFPAWDVGSPEFISEYYRRFYGDIATDKKFDKALLEKDFEAVRREYHWIDKYGSNILVSYENELELFEDLAREARESGINGAWISRANKLSVNASIRPGKTINDIVEPVNARKPNGATSQEESGWYILLDKLAYSIDYGLNDTTNHLDYLA